MAKVLILTLLFALVCGAADPTVSITDPKDETVVHPGDTVPVTVSTSGAVFMNMMIEPMIPIEPIYSHAGESSPYRFEIHIPSTLRPGLYPVMASGTIALGHGVECKAIQLDVERSDSPISLRTEPAASLNLHSGDRTKLRVLGTFRDGSIVDLTNSTQKKWISVDPAVVLLGEANSVTAHSPGLTEIHVHVGSQMVKVKVQVSGSRNR